jgi:hypothetical protein
VPTPEQKATIMSISIPAFGIAHYVPGFTTSRKAPASAERPGNFS